MDGRTKRVIEIADAAGVSRERANRCLRKASYGNRKTAVDATANLRRRYGKRYEVYLCNYCNMYHVGGV